MPKFFGPSLNFQDIQVQNLALNLLSTDPGSPAEGQIWYNTTANYPKVQLSARTMTISDQYVSSIGVAGIVATTGGLTPTLSLTSSATSGQALLSAGTGNNPAFGALNLGGGSSIITGILPVTNLATGVIATPGTYFQATVDTYGRVTAGSNPTTLGGFGITDAVNVSLLGVASGVATLDGTGKVPTSQLPAAVTGAMSYQGVWNANTNSPTLSSGVGSKGYYYKVSVAGTTTIDTVNNWNVGDMIVFDGTVWDKIDGPAEAVTTVAGRTGAITLAVGDVSGAAPTASPTFTGTVTAPTFSASTQFTGSGAGLTNIPNSALTNSSVTIGSTSISLGATQTTISGLTSISATTFTGALSGNATSATTATNLPGGLLGSLPYQSAAATTTLLAGNTTSTKQFLTQTGNGSISAAPVWAGIVTADIATALTAPGPIGATTASTIQGTTITATTQFSGPGTGLTGTAASLSIGGTAATATNVASGALGSIHYQSAPSTTAMLAGITSTTPSFLTSTGTGAAAQAPTWTSSTGTGNVVLATSPSLTTPSLGVATATSINGLTLSSSTGTLTIANGSTLVTSGAYSITLTATAATVATLPSGTVTLMANPMTTAGDIIYGGTAGAATRLATGSGVLVGGATPSWSTTPTLTGTNFSSIPNGALTNSSVTIGSTSVSLGGTQTSLAGVANITHIAGTTSVAPINFTTGVTLTTAVVGAVEWDGNNLYITNSGPTRRTIAYADMSNVASSAIANAKLANSSVTIGSTSVSLGATQTTFAGVTSINGITLTSTTATLNLASGGSFITTGGYSLTLTATATTVATLPSGTVTLMANPMTTAGDIIYGGASGVPTRLATGSGVLVGGATPSWSTTPTLTGTNFSSIPNGALSNSSVTIGSTSISLGATQTTISGLTSISSTTFTGALSGNATSATTATTATNLASGALGSVPYQTSSANTSLLAGNTSSTKQFFTQTGTGTVSAAPAWAGIVTADIATALTTPGPIGGTTPSTIQGTTITATTQFSGPGTGLTGNATSLSIGGNAATVTTIPTLGGDVSNSGNTVTLTATAVTGKALTGYTIGSNAAIAATDTILGAFGKTQAQINAIAGKPSKATGLIGNGSSTSINFNHGLALANQNAYVASVCIESTGEIIVADIVTVDANNITLSYQSGLQPATNAHRVTVIG